MRLALEAMGTRFELVLVEEQGSAAERASLLAAGEAALEEIRDQHRRLSRFEPASLVSHLGRWAHAGWVELDAPTFELLEEGAEVWRASGGAFDPTVAPLMDVLLGSIATPEEGGEALAAARAALGWEAVELDPGRRALRFARRGIGLDLGAIAKGHALDLAAEALREAGVTRALLHGGTSAVWALGAPPGSDAWRVELAGMGGTACALRDAALAISAPHGRCGAEGGHVLDPRRGTPARGVRLAAVAGPRARPSDAWSTALVAGAPEPSGPSAQGLSWLVLTEGVEGPEGAQAPAVRRGGSTSGACFEGLA